MHTKSRNLEDKPIGGYFGWEFPLTQEGFPHQDGVLLNSCHHAIQYLLQHLSPVIRVYIAYYTCDSVEWPLKALNLGYGFYHINRNLEISEDIALQPGEYIIYTNYFGIKDAYIKHLKSKYGSQLIIDNAQAYYAKDIVGCYQIYSPRKYVGIPDGGILIPTVGSDYETLDQSYSYECCNALLQRADGEIAKGYKSFKDSEGKLEEQDVRRMSILTITMLSSMNHASIVERRRNNFIYLHDHLQESNKLSTMIGFSMQQKFECPMVYPYYTNDMDLRDRLISNKIFVARYWPNVLDWCKPGDTEYELTTHIIPLPIDQRYGKEDMDRIIKIINHESIN